LIEKLTERIEALEQLVQILEARVQQTPMPIVLPACAEGRQA